MALIQTLKNKMQEQETQYRRLTQEQLDAFTLDMNTAYARLKGMEEAIDSESHSALPRYMFRLDQ